MFYGCVFIQKKSGETMQNRPDGSGMAFFGTVVLGAVVLWFGSYVVCGSFQKAIRTDSGPFRYDEAIHRSLLIRNDKKKYYL